MQLIATVAYVIGAPGTCVHVHVTDVDSDVAPRPEFEVQVEGVYV